MYSYSYPQRRTMAYGRDFRNTDERFFGGGIIAPLVLGGIAGYALGRPNYYPQPYPYPYPVPYANYPTYYNSYSYYYPYS